VGQELCWNDSQLEGNVIVDVMPITTVADLLASIFTGPAQCRPFWTNRNNRIKNKDGDDDDDHHHNDDADDDSDDD